MEPNDFQDMFYDQSYKSYKDGNHLYKYQEVVFGKEYVVIHNPNKRSIEIASTHNVSVLKIKDDTFIEVAYGFLMAPVNIKLWDYVYGYSGSSDVSNIIIGIISCVKNDSYEYKNMLSAVCDMVENEELAYEIFQEIEDEEFKVYMNMKFEGFVNIK